MGKQKIILTSVLMLLAIAAAMATVSVVLLDHVLDKERSRSEVEAHETYAEDRALISSESNLDFDPRDERKLIENSEEVFVGEVESLEAYGNNDPTPFLEGWSGTARFAVRVVEVKKDASPDDGLAPGQTITVNQLGVPRQRLSGRWIRGGAEVEERHPLCVLHRILPEGKVA